MLKLFTVVIMFYTSSLFAFSSFTTKEYVKSDLWQNGVKKSKEAKVQPSHRQVSSKGLNEEVLVPLLKLERELKISGQI